MNVMHQVLTSLAGSLVASALIVVLAVRPLRQYFRQRQWDRKSELYYQIVEDLSSIWQCLDHLAVMEFAPEGQEGRHQLIDSCMQCQNRLERATIGGRLLLSNRMMKLLRGLLNELALEAPREEDEESLKRSLEVINKYLPKLTSEAKRRVQEP